MKLNASQALAFTLASKPGTSVLTPYHGRNMKMSSATALAPATISPKLILEVSTGRPLESGEWVRATLTCRCGWIPIRETERSGGLRRPARPARDAERRAAVHLRERLRQMGREAELEAIEVRPRFGLVHTFHALLAIVGSVVAVSSPIVGAALVLAAGLLALLDLTGRVPGHPPAHRAARLAERVLARGRRPAPGTLILVAHYDVGRDAPAFRLARRALRAPWAGAARRRSAPCSCAAACGRWASRAPGSPPPSSCPPCC